MASALIRRRPFILFLFALSLSLLGLHAVGIHAAPADSLLYVGTYTEHGSKGIYAFHFDSSSGHASPVGLAAETADPSFLAFDPRGDRLYAVNEMSEFHGQSAGAVSAFSIDSATGLLFPLDQVSSRGAGPAFVAVDRTGKFVMVANYDGGSVAVFTVLPDGRLGDPSAFVRHHGSSVNHERQSSPHAHAIAISSDNRFAIVADLGLDQLIPYPFDERTGKLGLAQNITPAHPGSGPRHLIFDRDGKFLYVIDEISSEVNVYRYEPRAAVLTELQTISTLPEGFSGQSTAAEIALAPSGKFLYASNRGDDSIAVFAVHRRSGLLSKVERVPTLGRTPRNFALDPTGKWLLAANQDSDSIVIFRVDPKSGHLTSTGRTLGVSSPVCVLFIPER
ncbi:MAG: lactonase family protein [Candidatus Acidiferrales bacterium]